MYVGTYIRTEDTLSLVLSLASDRVLCTSEYESGLHPVSGAEPGL